MKARLKFYRQAPRKARLVANFVRGKTVSTVLSELQHLDKRAAHAFSKLITSAVTNAKNTEGLDKEELIVKEIRVDKGITFRRFRARSRGRAAPIKKETSHISVVLGTTKKNTEATNKNSGTIIKKLPAKAARKATKVSKTKPT